MHIYQVWEARVAVANDTKKSISDVSKPLSQVSQEVGSPATQVSLTYKKRIILFMLRLHLQETFL